MADAINTSGSCVCGSVRFVANTASKSVGACHCSICRKWGGGPFFAIDCGTDVAMENEQNIGIFNSSEWAERGFCNQCGTHLFYRLKDTNQYIMPVGLFDDAIGFVFDHQVFIEQKPNYYCFANKTTNMTGEELFAQFAAEKE